MTAAESPLTATVTRLTRDVLGPDVLGVYLCGSATHGGLRPHSDVDIFAVTRQHTTQTQRRALASALLEISGEQARQGPARPVELTVVVESEVRPWRCPPMREFQYGEWLRADLERGGTPLPPAPDPDLAPLITMVLLADTPLYGPPPGEILVPVPHADLLRAIVAGVPDLLAGLTSDTRNVVLALARIWTTLATGALVPKDVAADWVLGRLPPEHRPVLSRARAVYLGVEPERWDDLPHMLQPYADHVVHTIRRLSNRAP